MMNKKYLCLFLALIMILTAGCAKIKDDKLKIGLLPIVDSLPFYVCLLYTSDIRISYHGHCLGGSRTGAGPALRPVSPAGNRLSGIYPYPRLPI